MTDIHIDDFHKDVAVIFLRLYKSFPRKVILYVEDICGEDQPDEFGLHSERFTSGFSTMVWLAEHGYLNFESAIKQEALDKTVLSEQGFLLLSSLSDLDFGEADTDDLPDSVLQQARSNINQLRKAVNSRSSIMIQQCVQHMLHNRFSNKAFSNKG
ncbi:MAG: hypothetical protein ACJAYG_000885 [Oceanicoccus sp.]|jgi:hypothetical protein